MAMYFRFTPALRFILPVLILWVTSCEKVIDLNLKGVEAKYVIEGTLSNQPGDCQVLISQTKDFDQDNDFPGISGATVTILSTGDETATTLTETAPGIYKAPAPKGTNGETYTLKVIIGENTFTSSSTMPEQVLMDTIYVTEETLFGETWKLANITFPDPAGVANKYRFIQYINSVRTEELFIRDDQLVNGREFETNLYMTPGTDR